MHSPVPTPVHMGAQATASTLGRSSNALPLENSDRNLSMAELGSGKSKNVELGVDNVPTKPQSAMTGTVARLSSPQQGAARRSEIPQGALAAASRRSNKKLVWVAYANCS